MLDGVTLDQLRTFVTAVDEGSFSAAARKLRRAQSAVSEMVRGLESQVGVALFDRSGRYPALTAQGTALISDARSIIARVDAMKSRAKGMSEGLEPELSAVIDVFFPIDVITQVATEFREKFPDVPLRIYMDTLGGAFQPLIDKRARIAIVGSLPPVPLEVIVEDLYSINLTFVAAACHPLASYQGPIPRRETAKHTQLVLTDRSELTKGREFGVMSPSTWRLADLSAKHAFLLNGLGWGSMPTHMVKEEIDSGKLVELEIEDMSGALSMSMSAMYRTHEPPGPAGRWFIERLKSCRISSESTSTT